MTRTRFTRKTIIRPRKRQALADAARVEAGGKITFSEVRDTVFGPRRTVGDPPQERRGAYRLTSYPSPSQERRELNLPSPSDEDIANKIWQSIFELVRYGLRTDWKTALEQKLSALDDAAKERRVRALLQQRCSDEIARVTTELEHLRAVERHLTVEEPARRRSARQRRTVKRNRNRG